MRSILRDAHRFVMLHPLSAPHFRKDRRFLRMPIRGNDEEDRFPHRFRGRVSEEAFGGGIPGEDLPFQRLTDNGVVGSRDDRGKQLLRFIGAPARRDVAEDQDRSSNDSFLIANRRDAVVDQGLGSVSSNQNRAVGKPDDCAFA